MTTGDLSGTSYPLSAAQRQVWLDMQLRGDATAWNIGEYIIIEGAISWSLFKSALEVVISRTTALRLVFDLTALSAVQRITSEVCTEAQFLSFKSERDPAAAAAAWMQAAYARPFAGGRPWTRFALLEIADDRFYFFAGYSHLAVDAFGMAYVAHALARTYTQLAAGAPPTLLEDERDYRAFLSDDAAFQDSEPYFQERQFWSSQYSTPAPIVSASQRDSGAAAAVDIGREVHRWDAEATRLLEEIATRNGIRLHYCFGALAAIYLSRVTGASDIPIGFAVHGRERRFSRLIAMCANVIPARVSLDLEMPLDTAVVRLASQLADAVANGRYRGLSGDRRVRLTKSPPFSLIANVIRLKYELRFGAARSVYSRYLSSGPVDDLTFIFRDGNHASRDVADVIAYGNRSLYGAGDLQQHLTCLRTLIVHSHECGGTPLAELQLQTATEAAGRRQSLTGAVVPAADRLLHEAIQRACASNPRAIALHESGGDISYGELDALATRVANTLLACGIQPEAVVGVHVPRSSLLVIAMLGIFKAGAVYLPLDPQQPAARNAAVLRNAAAPCLLFSSKRSGQLPDYAGSQVDLERVLSSTVEAPHGRRSVPQSPQRLSYIITTSGSSGKPKAVMVSHAAALNHVRWLQSLCPLSTDDRIAFKTTVCFDASFNEVLWPLLGGAQIVILPDDGPLDPASLVELITRRAVTILQLVPSLLERLLAEPAFSLCTTLRVVVSAGEALPGATASQLLQRLPGVRLLNLYGPTEAAVDATSFECRPEQAYARVPIGRPIANTRVYVLDSALQLVPPGTIGDLWIAGSGLARGYCRAPGLTADSFRADPCASAGERMYRTGDRVRYQPDGLIDYIGRADTQVKIRGFRIELGEIEAALRANAAVREAAVLAIEYASSDVRVVAFVVPRDASAFDIGALRAALSRVLPDYMVPVSCNVLAALPRLSNGKIDSTRLKESVAPHDSPATTAEAPDAVTSLEQSLRGMWSAVLHAPDLGLHDSLFDHGGSSLHAMLIVRQISERFGVRIPVREVFDRPSVAEFSAVLRSRLDTLPAAAADGQAGRTQSTNPMITLGDFSQS